ncbi:membrane protein [Shewanella sairae]|uniref:Membrane protein n=1 Tax=Shewanella sairae TaxID=190310 RepID=A0ABQ4PRM8_9GAMM|nr:GDYXXLXY domain-containing protein [Shewanella sairae]MCL1131950.1 GDYXXLXY domain-containing protein [Shewanella sairae]GIU52383.1 membrane protein [Shewanella sairae]
MTTHTAIESDEKDMNAKHTQTKPLLPLSCYVVIARLLAVLGVVNWDIYQKEQHLAQGKIVRLALAPVDPRSLMQGDYMVLNYELAAQVNPLITEGANNGIITVALDKNQVASLVSVDEASDQQGVSDKQDNWVHICYRWRQHRIKFASNAYFFEEGQAQRYEQAEYGQFRVNEQGNLLLEALLDKQFNKL